MNAPDQQGPDARGFDEESVILHDISPQLEAELLRRAREKGTDPSTEATKIIERHLSGDADSVMD